MQKLIALIMIQSCYASNNYFADFFSLSSNSCSRIINTLKKKNYIDIELIKYGKTTTKRIIKCIKKYKNIEVENNFKGVWIPREIWLNDELTLNEKLFYAEIDSLDNDKGCYATNNYFADFFSLSSMRCSQIIKALNEKNYISIKYIDDKTRVLNSNMQYSIRKKTNRGHKENNEWSKENGEWSKENGEWSKENGEYNNKLNNIINNKNNRNNTFSDENVNTSFLKNPNNFEIHNFIKNNIYSIFKFKTRLPENENDKITQTYKNIVSNFIKIKNGIFINDIVLDKDYCKKNNINLNRFSKGFSDKAFLRIVTKAVTNFLKMFQQGYWPLNKKYIETYKNLNTFLYNPRTRKSMFLYCFFNEPRFLGDTADKIQDELNKISNNDYNVKILFQEFAKKINKSDWLENDSFWRKSKDIWKWYDEYSSLKKRYHKTDYFSYDFKYFLESYQEFILTWKEFNLGNYGYDNNTWNNSFENYIKTKHNDTLSIEYMKDWNESIRKQDEQKKEYYKTEKGKKELEKLRKQREMEKLNMEWVISNCECTFETFLKAKEQGLSNEEIEKLEWDYCDVASAQLYAF
jgi:hypothetical protein